ncbi:hypothetical protein [Paenibacillus sp. R14(2021)]|uniref:hypothetical protein n=1 Tax=Paenibacillus sp. R14(2021) TaxID=2859228 RepID=UPI001C61168C|nr:hypothetical protein [Paenibacillus sp. R14(2021)]
MHSGQAEIASSISGVRRFPDSIVVSYDAKDALTLYRTMESMAALANTTRFF